jgi:hypothetical protein
MQAVRATYSVERSSITLISGKSEQRDKLVRVAPVFDGAQLESAAKVLDDLVVFGRVLVSDAL